MNPLILLWATALTVAGVGTWVLFDGAWGVNTVVWTATAAAGLLVCARGGGARIPSTLVVTRGLAVYLVRGLSLNAVPALARAVIGAGGGGVAATTRATRAIRDRARPPVSLVRGERAARAGRPRSGRGGRGKRHSSLAGRVREIGNRAVRGGGP